jgi:hypothetical protein
MTKPPVMVVVVRRDLSTPNQAVQAMHVVQEMVFTTGAVRHLRSCLETCGSNTYLVFEASKQELHDLYARAGVEALAATQFFDSHFGKDHPTAIAALARDDMSIMTAFRALPLAFGKEAKKAA